MNDQLRAQFPALAREYKGRPLVFLDGPAGTQVPQPVIDAISGYYQRSNANSHGSFITTLETDHIIEEAREKSAQFLGAEGAHTISFGQNMTTLNFSLSHAIARVLQPGDEILITQLDHEANRGPWLGLRDYGLVVREIRLLPNGTLDEADMAEKVNERTRLIAIGYTSNLLGTANNLELARKLSYEVGAWMLVDAVHAAPHFSIHVQDLGCDFLLCSAYKFYGPHVGILYSKPGLLDRLHPDRLRTQDQQAPYVIETGTLNHAALAGVSAAIDFITAQSPDQDAEFPLLDAMDYIQSHELALAKQLYEGLSALPGVTVVGPSFEVPLRAPTVSFTVDGLRPEHVCEQLAAASVCAWDGHFYAQRGVEVLGLMEQGGVTRMGVSMYTTAEEIEYTLEIVQEISQQKGQSMHIF